MSPGRLPEYLQPSFLPLDTQHRGILGQHASCTVCDSLQHLLACRAPEEDLLPVCRFLLCDLFFTSEGFGVCLFVLVPQAFP